MMGSFLEGVGQGTASLGDVVTQLKGIVQQASSSNSNLLTLIAAIQAIFPRIVGTFTLAAAATTTVSQPSITTGSMVLWTPTNAAAGTLQGSSKSLYLSSVTAGTGFVVATADGTSAAGTETFMYTFTPA